MPLRILAPVLAAIVLFQGETADASQAARQTRDEEAVVLAVEGPSEEEGGLPGPEPNLKNSFAPEEYEAPWTWWLGVILTAVSVVIIVGFGLAYYILIHRPRQRTPQP
ncbi:MAG: hypothetical protein ABR592_03005 [Nitriliruptorales bacterium]